MGDRRYERPLEKVRDAPDRAEAIASLRDDEVVQALAAVSRASRGDPYLANVLATEAMNRVHRHRAITSTAAEALVSLNVEGRITHANPATSWLIGVSPDQLVGSHYREFLHVVDEKGTPLPVAECPVQRTLDTQARVDQEVLWFERASGEVFPALTSIAPIERDGSFDGVVLTYFDITERHRAQEALARERSRLYEILENLVEGVVLLSRDGRHEYVNLAAARMLGLPRESILGEREIDVRTFTLEGTPVPVDGWPSAQVLRSGESARSVRLWIERNDGTRIAAEINASALRDAAGNVQGVVLSFDDITDHTRAQARLAEELGRHEAFFAVIPDAIFHVSPKRRIVRANPAGTKLAGEEVPLAGRPIADLVHEQDQEALDELLADVFARGQPRARLRFRGAKGRYVRCSVIGFPLVLDEDVRDAYVIVRPAGAAFERRVRDLI